MKDWLQTTRKRIEKDLSNSSEQRYFSSSLYSQYHTVVPLIQRYVQGKTIDLGCGLMPFKNYLTNRVTTYHTLDLWPQSNKVTYVEDIQDMSTVPTASYDSAICFEVLEHIPDPFQGVREIYRILKPGGTVVISVPHLSRLHDQPYDFFRFTVYGLRYILEAADFEVLEIRDKGGLLSFLGHQISTLLLCATWPVPGLRQITWLLNKWLITRLLYVLDKMTGVPELFALGYVGVARKPIRKA